MVQYIEHDAEMDTWEALEIGMPVMARMHDILRDTDMGEAARQPLFANYLEPTQAMSSTFRGTHRIREWNPSPLELKLADEAEVLAKLVSSAEAALQADLPKQLVHGDFWDTNVLLRGGKLALVTDFDFMGERHRIDDIALTLYFTCLEFFEPFVSDQKLARLRRLLDAYDLGSEKPLSSDERAALPIAIARQPLWSVGGWVSLLDDENMARTHAIGTLVEVKWALHLINEVARWQKAFV